jgi:arsenate reductase
MEGLNGMPQLYFICTGNSCRSQMAEGFAKAIFGADWRIASGGLEAQDLNPLAVKVMAEKGIDISNNKSTVIDRDYLSHSDFVVALSDLAWENFPPAPSSVQRLFWRIPDPATARGRDEAEVLPVYRLVRDAIQRRVSALKAAVG